MIENMLAGRDTDGRAYYRSYRSPERKGTDEDPGSYLARLHTALEGLAKDPPDTYHAAALLRPEHDKLCEGDCSLAAVERRKMVRDYGRRIGALETKHAGPTAHYKRHLATVHKAVKATGDFDALAALLELGHALGIDLEPEDADDADDTAKLARRAQRQLDGITKTLEAVGCR